MTKLSYAKFKHARNIKIVANPKPENLKGHNSNYVRRPCKVYSEEERAAWAAENPDRLKKPTSKTKAKKLYAQQVMAWRKEPRTPLGPVKNYAKKLVEQHSRMF